jgi:hypothetical protein
MGTVSRRMTVAMAKTVLISVRIVHVCDDLEIAMEKYAARAPRLQ